MTASKKYDLGFNVGSLLSNAFESVIEKCDDFSKLNEGNCDLHYSIIPTNSENTQKKYLREILKRLKSTPTSILDSYLENDERNQKVIEFFTVCNTYTIIQEFMIEVVRNKWLNLSNDLERHDFKSFLLNKLVQTDDVSRVSSATVNKLSQIVLRMLKELGMYDGVTFMKIEVNPYVLQVIYNAGYEWFLDVMLLTENEKNEIKQW